MKKSFSVLLTLFVACFSAANAEKISVKITPKQIISTVRNETQIDDWIDFVIVKDVYADGKLFLKEGNLIVGVVDFVHENGFIYDNAEIEIKTFYTTDINNKKVKIDYPVTLTQNMVVKNNIIKLVFYNIKAIWRGSEILIEPDSAAFNIFIER